jgi:hypothetical protein
MWELDGGVSAAAMLSMAVSAGGMKISPGAGTVPPGVPVSVCPSASISASRFA